MRRVRSVAEEMSLPPSFFNVDLCIDFFAGSHAESYFCPLGYHFPTLAFFPMTPPFDPLIPDFDTY